MSTSTRPALAVGVGLGSAGHELSDESRPAAIGVTATDGAHESQPLRFVSRDGSVIRALAGLIDVVVRSAPGEPARVCAQWAG